VKSYVFRIVVEPDQMPDGTPAYHAYAPALKGCDSWGHDRAEALANAREAVELYVADLLDAGEPVPVDAGQGTIELEEPAVAVNV
jgi:antitoxin HicB